MFNLARKAFIALMATAGLAAPALAADYIPPVEELPPPPVVESVDFGGWYIRGDIGYHKSKFRGADYITYGVDPCAPCGPEPVPGSNSFDFGKMKGAFSLGGGVGYQVNQYFRTDLTVDYWFKSKFNGQTSDLTSVSVDTSSATTLLLLANAYADLGTWHGITPYVGAGIGGAHVKWDNLRNTIDGVDTFHKGSKNWRFAYALMAGASYCLTNNVILDAGYRFSHIDGGRMFELNGAGPGFDKGFNTHEVRGGLRYQFGNSGCAEPQAVAYEPEPIYTK
ncbi:opacity protein-like surface antigen [Mesorhizobium robiniae]|uniref:Opacity protein-like surface antigen n=1 Tax=Mesorhizobium robiniae TaxID=559315 RepID=A0ABV2GS37_9HYPH